MNYGMYLSAAGALSSMHRQDVLANNLANMNTVGFKPDLVDTRERLPERLEDPSHFADPKWLLEQLGGGLLVNPTRTAGVQGDLVGSGNPLDLAINGDGFFVLESGPGEANHMTRDGRMTINGEGNLVLAASGRHVVDDQGSRIQLDPTGPVTIDAAGRISQNGSVAGTIRIAAVTTDDLEKVGDNRFRMKDGAAIPTATATGRVQQGYAESSAVNPIITLNDMMNAAKAAQANLQMMQAHSKLLDETMNTFGRVA